MNWTRLVRRVGKKALVVVVVVVAVGVLLLLVLNYILGLACGCSKTVGPQASFRFDVIERYNQSDGLKVVHDGGDPIPNRNLSVMADIRFRAVPNESGSAEEHTWSALGHHREVITAGDSVLIKSADPEHSIYETTFRVVWRGTDENGHVASSTLGLWDGAAARPSPRYYTPTVVPSASPRTDRQTQTPWQSERAGPMPSNWTAAACAAYSENDSTTDTPTACQSDGSVAESTTVPS